MDGRTDLIFWGDEFFGVSGRHQEGSFLYVGSPEGGVREMAGGKTADIGSYR